MGTGRIEIIECPRDQQVRVGVEVGAELVGLIAQVAFDLEFDILRGVSIGRITRWSSRSGDRVLSLDAGLRRAELLAPELGVHHVVALVGDVSDHAGQAQPASRHHIVFIEMTRMKIRVGHDGAPGDFVERDVFGIEVGRAGDHDRMAHAFRILKRPAQRLHAAEAAAHHRGQGIDAEGIEQQGLRVDPVFDGDHGEISAIGAPGVRMGVHGPGRTEAGPQVVDANHEETIGVDRLAGADHVAPPSFGPVLAGVDPGDVVRCVERVADQYRIALVGRERPVRLEGECVVANRSAAAQCQRSGEEHRLWNGFKGHGAGVGHCQRPAAAATVFSCIC